MTFPIQVVQAVDCPQLDGSVWRRTGECNRCGECCKSGDPFADDQTTPANPCRLLVTDGAAYACGDRTSHVYLSGCNVWPSAPEHVTPYPSCSYVFERVL